MKKICLKHPIKDLFGDVIVTRDEVEQWVDVVARVPRSSPRREYYIMNWDVAGKIKAAKLAGKFEAIIAGGAAWAAC